MSAKKEREEVMDMFGCTREEASEILSIQLQMNLSVHEAERIYMSVHDSSERRLKMDSRERILR